MLELRVLGSVTLEMDGEPRPLGGRKVGRLLAILAAGHRRVHSSDELIEALWAGSPPASAAGTLQTYLTHLRRAFEPDRAPGEPSAFLHTEPHGYRLELPADAIDAERFERAVAESRDALTPETAGEVAARLVEALSLWRGRAFGDFADEDFARGRAIRLEELRMTALETRIEADLLAGRAEAVVPELESLVVDHPLRETLWGHLMVALYRCGRQSDALRAFQRVQRTLLDDLGLEPGPELQELELAVLRQDPDLMPPAPIERRAPPGTRIPPIPRPLTAFIGRRPARRRVRESLSAHRLTTITGPGGFGKTRLALEIASDEVGAGRTVVFVDAELAESEESVVDVFAAAAGVESAGAGRPGGAMEALADRRAVLVLDNAETFLAASIRVAADALAAVPDLTILATSRVPLGLSGEHLVPIGPLETPPPGTATSGFEAVELFLDRMGAGSGADLPDGALAGVAALSRAADGIPLAIELLAARLDVMTLDEVVSRVGTFLDDASSDEPSLVLSALLDWSYESLDERDRAVCEVASVFSGSFTLEMLERMVDAGTKASLPESIRTLFDRALLTSDASGGLTRYAMTQLLRRRVWSKVGATPFGAELARRHALVFADRAAAVEEAFGSPRWLEHLTALDRDHALDHDQGNFRRALAWAIDEQETETAFRLIQGLARYWRWRGRWSECEGWLDRALRLPDTAEHRGARGRLLRERASLARQTGAWAEALDLADAAGRAFEADGDLSGLADVAYDLGWGCLLGGRFTDAEAHFDRAIDLQAAAGSPGLASFPMVAKAWVRRIHGDTDGAEDLWSEASALNDLVGSTGVEFWLSDLKVDLGELDEAEAIGLGALEKASQLGFDTYRNGARYALARVAAARGDTRKAETLATAAIDGAQHSGAPEIEGFARRLRTELALIEDSDLDPASELEAFIPFAQAFGGPLGVAVTAELRAGLVLADRPGEAAQALRSARAVRAQHRLPLAGPERAWRDQRLAAVEEGDQEAPWSVDRLAEFAFPATSPATAGSRP